MIKLTIWALSLGKIGTLHLHISDVRQILQREFLQLGSIFTNLSKDIA